MLKRFLISLASIVLITAALGGYFLYSTYRTYQQFKLERQNSKAPDRTITIIEGWSATDIAAYLENKNIMPGKDFLQAERAYPRQSRPVLASLPESSDLEGFMFPDTYRIPQNLYADSAQNASLIINKMLDNFSAKFTDDMQAAAKQQNMSVYQIVTLASIIEKETGRNALGQQATADLLNERKIIAGIFYNRLKAGMPLESDATVNYVTKKKVAQSSYKDTRTNSPYNTYLNKGLPPGPICNPSLSSLTAALYPQASDYFYFLHTQPDGKAIFSKTYEEHLLNKQKYLK